MSEDNCQSVPQNITRHEAISEFEKIRRKQRQLYTQLMEAEIKLKEYCEVSKILRECNPNRKCYHLMLDQLIESDVRSVQPLFYREKDKVEALIEKLNRDIRVCAAELKGFQKAYNIRASKKVMNETFSQMPEGFA